MRARVVGAVLVVALGIAAAGGLWLRGRLNDAPVALATRLEAMLGADCKVDTVVPLDMTSVEISGVACAPASGPVAGAAARRIQATFASPPLSAEPPPVVDLAIYGSVLRLREREVPNANDDDSAPGDADLSAVLEIAALRFADATDAIAAGRGGERVPSVVARLADGGTVRLDRARLEEADGSTLVEELAIHATRAGEAVEVAIATRFPAGGLATFEGVLGEQGLHDGRLAVEGWPLAETLQEAAGERVEIRAGRADGALVHRPGPNGSGEWGVEASIRDLQVAHDFLGGDVPLPLLGLTGTLRPTRDEAGLVLAMEESRWSVGEQGGPFHAMFGPFGADGEPLVTTSIGATELSLGRLLEQLPETLLPSEWAREIRGTVDFGVELGGPVHDRTRWELDWNSDFSRLSLASGELAAEVELLRGSFSHEFPTPGDGRPLRRRMGPEDDAFVSIANISPHLVAAVVSTEDAGFFAHSGFEAEELKLAVLENLREGSGRGGSTITQQLAKNLFLSGERSVARKLKEAVIAWRLEEDLPKRRILEIYLNIAEWGPGLYGVRDAADHYFHRTPARLKPEEAAFLASLLPSPRRYHRYYHRGGVTPHLRERLDAILSTMRRLGSLDARQYHLARGEAPELSYCRLATDE